MAEDNHLSDEDIRAAARHWLAQDHWKDQISRSLHGRAPGDLRREHHDIPRQLLELDTDEQSGVNPLWARRHEVAAALETAGYPEQCDMNVLDRTADVMIDIIREQVEKRMREVFRPEAAPATISTKQSDGPAQKTTASTPRLLDHVEPWQKALVTGRRDVKPVDPHSAGQYGVSVRLFSEIVGNRPMDEITYEDAEHLKDQIQRLSKSHGKGRHVHALTAIRMADEAGAERITLKTAKRHNTALNRYWDWLVFAKLIPREPSSFLAHKFPGTKSSSSDRDAWTSEDMERLFHSSDYRSLRHDDAYHWLPLVSLHSGMRLEEICRLRPRDDIQSVNGVQCFVIQKHPDGWDPKTEAGERKVPIHPWLIEHGLLDLIERRRGEGAGRVFSDLRLRGKSTKLGAGLNREFSRIKIGMGFGPKLVLHSFRHTFRTELESSDFDDRHINSIMGHEGEGRGEGRTYVKGVAMRKLQQVVKSFRCPLKLDFLHHPSEGAVGRKIRLQKRKLQPRVTD